MSLKAKQGSLIGKGQFFSEKLHENEKKFDWGKRIPSAPSSGSANEFHSCE